MKPVSITPGAVSTLFAVLLLLSSSHWVHAQEADVSGTWIFDVTTDAGSGMPTVTLVQNGENLEGHYSSTNLGEADLMGNVANGEIRFAFEATAQGLEIEVTYTGMIQDDGSLTGTLDLGGFASGTFTARRQ